MATLPKAFQERMARPKTVLVIDDDRSIRELLSLHLANRGYDVAVAEDAVVGGRLALSARPQLISYLRAGPYEVGVLLHFGPTPKFFRLIDSPKRRHGSIGFDQG